MKKALCVLAAAALLLTGCGSKDPDKEEDIGSYVLSFGSAVSPTEAPDYNIITGHEGNWSREELMSVCYIFGTQLTPAMTPEYLGWNYIADTELTEVNTRGEADCILDFRCINGNVTDILPVGTMTLGGISSLDEITGSTPVHEISINTAELPEGYVSGISLNGADLGDTQRDCTGALGSPQLALDQNGDMTFPSSASLMVYTDENGSELLILNFDDDDRLAGAVFFFEGHENMF